jgi:hypothetical protein
MVRVPHSSFHEGFQHPIVTARNNRRVSTLIANRGHDYVRKQLRGRLRVGVKRVSAPTAASYLGL